MTRDGADRVVPAGRGRDRLTWAAASRNRGDRSDGQAGLVATVLLAALLMVVGAAPAQRAAAPAKLTGGNGTLYIGGWPNKIFVIDEATEKVTGTIDVKTAGHPRAVRPSMVLSKDRSASILIERDSRRSRSSTSRRARASTTSR